MPVDLGAEYLHGMSAAASIAEAHQRLSAERERTQMEAQAREQTEQRITLEETARRQTQTAYKDASLALQQQRLQQAAQQHAAAAREAALKISDMHAAAADYASGQFTDEQVMYRHPRAWSYVGSVNEEHRKAKLADLSGERLDLNRQKAAAAAEAKQAALDFKRNALVKTGEDVVTDPDNAQNKHITYRYGQPQAAAGPAPLPVPKTKAEMQKGMPYQTHKGVLTWNGEKLVKPPAAQSVPLVASDPSPPDDETPPQ